MILNPVKATTTSPMATPTNNLVQAKATSPKAIASPTHGNVQRFISFTFTFLFRGCKSIMHAR